MLGHKKKATAIAWLLLLFLPSVMAGSMLSVSRVYSYRVTEQDHNHDPVEEIGYLPRHARPVSRVGLSQSKLLENETFSQSVFSFVRRSQETGQDIPSMDMAYYKGMALFYLDAFSLPVPNALRQDALEFAATSRNSDGGYGNWKDARSSMESTFQCLQLLLAHNNLTSLDLAEVNRTLEFVHQLKTPEQGYLPLLDWDAPDVSSSFRAISVYNLLQKGFPQLNMSIDNSSTVFLANAFAPPIFANGASGYAENVGGPAELLASLNAIQVYLLLNITNPPNLDAIGKFLNSLVALNGGVAGRLGGFPTTGYTASALHLYLLLKTKTAFDIDSYLPPNFLENAKNYILANRIAGSGFAASERDTTPEVSSTFFSLRVLYMLDYYGFLSSIPDLTGVYSFIVEGVQPTYGFGDYPGDVPDVSYSAYAILLGRILGNTSWINPAVKGFVEDSYRRLRGGFGFRPFSTARVKYTYFGIRALRGFESPLVSALDIRQFILNSQNGDGGFGEQPASRLSYLTHSYWSIASLRLLGGIDEKYLDFDSVVNWLSYLRKPNGTYSNFPGHNSTLASTYRAVQVCMMLGQSYTRDDPLYTTLMNYQLLSGGFLNSLDEAAPTMEATFYGVSIALMLGRLINRTQIRQFVLSLHNKDGGFGLRPGYSSRVKSSFYAILTLELLESSNANRSLTDFSEDPFDIYAPIVSPAFIPRIDTNRTFQGSYVLTSTIIEPESILERTWVQAEWTNGITGETTRFRFNGSPSQSYANEWSFRLEAFREDGFLRFRVHAVDANNNSAATYWMYLRSLSTLPGGDVYQMDVFGVFLPLLFPFILALGIVDGAIQYSRGRRLEKSEVLMTIRDDKTGGIFGDETRSMIALFLVMGAIGVLARMFLQDAIIVLENSLFLFRFLIGMVVILFVKYVVGVKTLGLFGPAVLVISMLLVGPAWGMAIFLNIFVLGYVVRLLLRPFNLALGFRIGILMIFTVSYIGLLELIGEVFLIPSLSGSILVPIIITPWFIDKYVVEIEQEDHLQAFYRLMVTLAVTSVSFLFMSIDSLVHALVVNPELWVVLTASTLYFGRNTKYTMIDKKRFSRLLKGGKAPLSLQIRNRNFIARYNSQILYPVINKLNMKEQFEKWRVPTAELLAIVESENQLPTIMRRLAIEEQFKHGFVVKPSQSFGGKGILIVRARDGNGNFVVSNDVCSPTAIEKEIRRILQGEYLTSQTLTDRDIVLIEERISTHPDLAKISTGLPDVRVIIFRGIPVMAMMRLSTMESQGRANLKQGAIGAAVKLSSGLVYRAEIKGTQVERHPDTREKIVGFALDNWLEILSTACLAQKSSGLGYAGVDVVICEDGRTLVLEVNKRPGLEIQNVCQDSLLSRLDMIEKGDIDASEFSAIRAARFAIELALEHWEKEEY